MFNIIVIGMGYVGIPTAALFASVPGINVIGLQRLSKRSGWKVDWLNKGKNPIFGEEPELDDLIKKVANEGKLKVTNDYSIISEADVVLIDLQTPIDSTNKSRYDHLINISREIGNRMKKGTLISLESTVSPGTTEYIIKPILENSSGYSAARGFNLIYSYERVMAGRLLHNLKFLPRVIGGYSKKCTEIGVNLYKKVNFSEIYTTDLLTAEVSKLVENAYRDVNISFANEIALICETLGVNYYTIQKFVNSLPNIPSNPAKNPYRMLMQPGAGVGGHCLPKDPYLLIEGFEKFGKKKIGTRLMLEARRINDYMPTHMFNLIKEAFHTHCVDLKNSKITILGYAFLENCDDNRNSPAKPLYLKLYPVAREVIIHDPYVKDFDGLNFTRHIEKAIDDSDCIVLVTKHKEYQNISLKSLKDMMKTPIIVDGRNLFNPEDSIKMGFTFKGIGIGSRIN